ncbi:outer membrane protein, heavy metal efflux system [Pararobbsia alpina]|uniref:TolC family protein n=1 Tax=Pararobbsia alpina TaxID=621374 RepID=UPI0039A681CD
MPLFNGTPLCRCVPLRACAVFFALAISSFSAFAQEAPLTLDAAIQAATEHSAAIGAARASVRASSQAAVKAGQLPEPALTAGVDDLPINGSQGFTIGQNILTMRRIGIEQEWVSGEKRRLRSSLADEQVGREHAGYLEQLVNVRQQTASAWLDATYAKQAVALQQELLEHMRHELAATEASYKGARASATDVVQAQAMLAQTQDQMLTARQTLVTALIRLSRWTATAVDDVAGEPPSPESTTSALPLDDLRHVQPALITAAHDISLADADTAVAESNRTPNWTWNVSYAQGGNNSRFVSVGVRIPLPFNRSNYEDRDIAEKGELATKARLTYEDAQRQVQADIHTEAATLASGRARIANLSQSLLPAADQRVQLAVAAYKGGTGSLADTFAARRAQLDAELQVLSLRRDVSQLWTQLEYQVVPPTMADGQ